MDLHEKFHQPFPDRLTLLPKLLLLPLLANICLDFRLLEDGGVSIGVKHHWNEELARLVKQVPDNLEHPESFPHALV